MGMLLLILPTLKWCMSGFIDRSVFTFSPFFINLKYGNNLNFIVAEKWEEEGFSRNVLCTVNCKVVLFRAMPFIIMPFCSSGLHSYASIIPSILAFLWFCVQTLQKEHTYKLQILVSSEYNFLLLLVFLLFFSYFDFIAARMLCLLRF